MALLHVLRVFTGAGGIHGNALGVVLDGRAVADHERQGLAAQIGFSETVFVDDRAEGRVRIHTPAVELPFAGHPLVGTAWLLRHEEAAVDTLRPPAGCVTVSYEGDRVFVASRPEWSPDYELVDCGSAAAVEALEGPPGGGDLVMAFAHAGDGEVRARVFPRSLGIAEDEATGSAAVRLGAQLGRPVTIRQGVGSEIEVRPLDDGRVEVGGRAVLDEVRALTH